MVSGKSPREPTVPPVSDPPCLKETLRSRLLPGVLCAPGNGLWALNRAEKPQIASLLFGQANS